MDATRLVDTVLVAVRGARNGFDWFRVIELLVVLAAASLAALAGFYYGRKLEGIRVRMDAFLRLKPAIDGVRGCLGGLWDSYTSVAHILTTSSVQILPPGDGSIRQAQRIDDGSWRARLETLRAGMLNLLDAQAKLGQTYENNEGFCNGLRPAWDDLGVFVMSLYEDTDHALGRFWPVAGLQVSLPAANDREPLAVTLRDLAERAVELQLLHSDFGTLVHNHLLRGVAERLPLRQPAEGHILVLTNSGVARADRARRLGKEAVPGLAEARRSSSSRDYWAKKREDLLRRAGAHPAAPKNA